MSVISPVSPSGTPIVPILPIATPIPECASCVSGFTLALTTFILGSIFMLILIAYIFIFVFGQPMSVAKNAATQGSIIQHFNTSKSSVMKIATIAGDAFRYKSIRDGTVATSAKSVCNLGGRNIVLTFANLGVTIPIYLLGGVSILVHNGINNINDLRKKLSYTEIYTEKRVNPDTLEEETVEVGRGTKLKNEVVIEGYDFENFENLLKQSKEEKLIPLVVEAVPDFVDRNISADYTEKKIKIKQMMMIKQEPGNGDTLKIMAIVIGVVIILIVGMMVK